MGPLKVTIIRRDDGMIVSRVRNALGLTEEVHDKHLTTSRVREIIMQKLADMEDNTFHGRKKAV